MLTADAVTVLPLLDADACAETAKTVMGLTPWWVQRHPMAPFYTLGAASYLDATPDDDRAAYMHLARQVNPVLDASFAWLFGRVTTALADWLDAPVGVTTRQARPGFHVFLAHPAFQQPVARIHCDLQHELLDWEGATPDATLSFTLPVVLPAAGGGMDVWALDQDAWLALDPPGRLAALERHPRRDVVYSAGDLVVHSGRLVHRISATPELAPTDSRLTLQGHGVRIDGRWELYW